MICYYAYVLVICVGFIKQYPANNLNTVKIVSKLIFKNGTIIFLNHNSIFFKIVHGAKN